MSDDKGRILNLSQLFNGKVHDKKILDEFEITIEKNTAIYLDTGFKGYKNDNGRIIIPAKRTKGVELTEEEKDENTLIASDRVKNEH